MTPSSEGTFIALWQEGLGTAEIARRLGIPYGTVLTCAKRLLEHCKIQPRPCGGAYP